jgi:2-methylcitrate dehydratase PrpD
MERTVSEKIGRFVRDLSYDQLPEKVIEKSKCCLINGLAIVMSAHNIKYCRMARELIKNEEMGIPPERGATLFCDGSKVTPMGAAFANAALFHGRVQEDTLGSSHAGTVAIPVVLALAERGGYAGKQILEATIAAYEIVGQFDSVVSMQSTPRGFRASAIFGIFGSAAAASKILGLNEEETIHALGFAAAFAGGTLQGFVAGTMEWRYEVGVASRGGMTAALLARQGAKSARTAIEGEAGFLKAFAGDTDGAELLTSQLGKEWAIMNAGFKPFPVCAFNQTPVRSILELIKESHLSPQEIEKIEIRVSPYEYHYAGLAGRGPFDSAGAALMSTPFCVALATLEGQVTIEGLDRFDDRKIMETIKKIEHRPDETLSGYSCITTITTKDGNSHLKESKEGATYYNFSMEQTIELAKRVTSEAGVSEDKVDGMIDITRNIEEVSSIKALTELMGTSP